MPGLSIDDRGRLICVVSYTERTAIRTLTQAGWRRIEENGMKGVVLCKAPFTRVDIELVLQLLPDVRLWRNVREYLRRNTGQG